MMFHISDLKKYNRCKRMYCLDQFAEKRAYQPFVRLDEQVSDLAAKKLGVENAFTGTRGDDPDKALAAMDTHDWLIKARFEYDLLRVKVPFLHRHGDGWDLYFLFIGLYPHSNDMQFYCDTVWVLENLGIELKNMYVIHLNGDYVRQDELDLDQLFIISDHFYNGKNHPTQPVKDAVYRHMRDLRPLLHEMAKGMDKEPEPVRTSMCSGRQKCRYYDGCFPEEAIQEDNSILTLIGSQYRYDMKNEGRLYLRDADESRIEGSRLQYAQITADRLGGLYCDKMAMQDWLSRLSYPITCIDFEWERYAIPPYPGMRPYDVLLFEYSIHIIQEDGTIDHKVYLSIHDQREDFARSLIRDIPKEGTVLAYNAEGAEKIRIAELAEIFPQYKEELLDINERMEDLQLPFESGMVYDVRMRGQWSLKKIMAMMDDPGYQDLDIQQGMDAVFEWRRLDQAEELDENDPRVSQLKEYCGMDSYAMTVVLAWLKEISA